MDNTRIMIVEDESIVALDMKRRLTKLGYDVAALADSAQTALLQAERVSPDLILMDIKLKGDVDGITAAELINKKLDIPIVFLSAFADEATLQRAKQITPYGYLLKPFQEQELHTTIATALYRHQMERKLRENERWLEATLRSIGDGVIATNSAGVIQFMNSVAASLTGWEMAEALGRTVDEVFKVSKRPHVPLLDKRFAPDLAHDPVFEPTYRTYLAHLSGSETPIEQTTNAIMDENGRSWGRVIVFRDVSERHHLEKKIREYTVALHSQNQELDAFAYTAAHDLQSPLSPIIGLTEILQRNYHELSEEDIRTYLQAISKSGRKLANIIDELLTLAQVRKADVDMKTLEMADIVAEAVERLTYLSNEYRAQVELPESWPKAIGYGPWVEEVWANYISNAIKYGGRPPRIKLGATVQEDGYVRFWVQDNGSGLTPEQQQKLFTPFTQLHQVSRGGSGLGLSIVRRIVRKLGGDVGIDSTIDRGSIFSFTLPAANHAGSSLQERLC